MIYIDIETGTWGHTGNLRAVEYTPEVFELLSDASDAEVIDCGLDCGYRIDHLLEDF